MEKAAGSSSVFPFLHLRSTVSTETRVRGCWDVAGRQRWTHRMVQVTLSQHAGMKKDGPIRDEWMEERSSKWCV